MPDQTTTPLPSHARATFSLLATHAAKLQPEARGKAIAATAKELADLVGDLPLTPVDLADAYAALSISSGSEPAPLRARRQTCAELAALMVAGTAKVAGQRPPGANAMRVWAWIAEAFQAGPDAIPDALARARTMRATAAREHVELIGRAALAVIGRGQAQVIVASAAEPSRFLSTVKPDGKGNIEITALAVGEGKAAREYRLPVPLVVHQQAAIHKVGHPWVLMGLEFGDTGHDHP